MAPKTVPPFFKVAKILGLLLGDATSGGSAAKTACLCVAAVGLILLSAIARRLWWIWDRRQKGREPLPPGPPAEFLIGHLRVVPKEGTAEAYARWGREYGEFFFFLSVLFRLGCSPGLA
jgi:hypothetical protein